MREGNAISIIDRLENEAKRCDITARIMLLLVFLVAILASLFFIFASDFTNRDIISSIRLADNLAGPNLQIAIQNGLDPAKILQSRANIDAVTSLIAVSVTRISALIISLFLIHILINLFRYHVRLSNYYRGKAISLYGSDGKEAKDLLSALSPESIDFSMTPSLPYEKVLDIAKRQ